MLNICPYSLIPNYFLKYVIHEKQIFFWEYDSSKLAKRVENHEGDKVKSFKNLTLITQVVASYLKVHCSIKIEGALKLDQSRHGKCHQRRKHALLNCWLWTYAVLSWICFLSSFRALNSAILWDKRVKINEKGCFFENM